MAKYTAIYTQLTGAGSYTEIDIFQLPDNISHTDIEAFNDELNDKKARLLYLFADTPELVYSIDKEIEDEKRRATPEPAQDLTNILKFRP